MPLFSGSEDFEQGGEHEPGAGKQMKRAKSGSRIRRIDKDAQDYILGYSQPSLAGLFLAFTFTQDCVLGYSQPSLRD